MGGSEQGHEEISCIWVQMADGMEAETGPLFRTVPEFLK